VAHDLERIKPFAEALAATAKAAAEQTFGRTKGRRSASLGPRSTPPCAPRRANSNGRRRGGSNSRSDCRRRGAGTGRGLVEHLLAPDGAASEPDPTEADRARGAPEPASPLRPFIRATQAAALPIGVGDVADWTKAVTELLRRCGTALTARDAAAVLAGLEAVVERAEQVLHGSADEVAELLASTDLPSLLAPVIEALTQGTVDDSCQSRPTSGRRDDPFLMASFGRGLAARAYSLLGNHERMRRKFTESVALLERARGLSWRGGRTIRPGPGTRR
jgi:hypothetical protein